MPEVGRENGEDRRNYPGHGGLLSYWVQALVGKGEKEVDVACFAGQNLNYYKNKRY